LPADFIGQKELKFSLAGVSGKGEFFYGVSVFEISD